jgi:O-antigen biosynthesis protein WbqP
VYRKYFKRLLDVLLSSIGLIAFSPFLLTIAVAIKIESAGPVLFRQERVGRNKTLFRIYKYRTMRMDTPRDIPTHQLQNPEGYITGVGRFLRRTSLDELPQIINILKGEMAVIGPRPALWNQDDLIAERDKYRANSVRPGLTGWAQINGRDELEIPEKAKFDGVYVQRMSFLFDLKCLIGTITSISSSKGVVEGGTGELKRQKGDTNLE